MARSCRVPFTLVFLAAAASAQNTAFTISNLTFSGATDSGGKISGTGSVMVAELASGTIPFTQGGTSQIPCGGTIALSQTLMFDSTDSLTISESFPPNCTGANSFTVTTSFTVTGGTGAYSGRTGSGTLTFNISSSQKNGVGPFMGTGSGSGTLAPQMPTINPSGIVPVYSTIPTIQPGEWVSIYGAGFASSTAIWNGDFPTSLGGASVTIDNNPAYLWFVSPTQINLQVPADPKTGSVPVVLKTANGTFSSTVTLASVAPSFSLLDATHVTGIIPRSDGSGANGGGTYDILGPTGNSLGYPTVAAKAGDTVVLFAVGLGPTDPVVPPGQLYSSAARTVNPVNVLINNVSVTPSFAGLSSAGLYQINLIVPPGLGSGDVSMQATVNGAQTQSGVVMSLQGASSSNPTLTITTSGRGNGTVAASPPGTSCGSGCFSFTAGTAVTLTATAANGSAFAGWSGACSGTGACSLTMNSNQSVNAAFNQGAGSSVTGVAASGSPISGATVTLKDSTGKTGTATTAADGSYTVNTTGMTPPFLVQVQTAKGNLYSVSADGLTTTTINTHPLTDLIIRSWYSAQGQSADSAFSNPVSLPAPAPAGVQLIGNVVTNLAQLWLTNAGVNSASFNLISSPFAANGSGLDQVLAETAVNTGAGTVNIAAGGITQTSTITYDTGASTMTIASKTTNSHGASVSSNTSVIPTQSAQQAALNGINSTWTAIANAVNSNGSQLTAAELMPFVAADLLNDGQNQSQFTASLATTLRGLTLSSIQPRSTYSLDLTHGLADILFDITLGQLGASQTKSKEFWFENVAGSWLVGGDRRIADISLSSQNQTREGSSSGSGALIIAQVQPPAGTVKGVTVTDTSGVSGFSSTPLGQTAQVVQTFQPTPTTTLTFNLDNFGLDSNFLGNNLVPAGTPFIFALTPASGPMVSYTLPTSVFTTDSVSITSPTGGKLSTYTLGQPLAVNWTLPTTFAIAQVKLDAIVFTGPQTSPSSLSCQTSDMLFTTANATSGTITIPATCSGQPVAQVNLIVLATGVNGEDAEAIVFIQ